MISIDGRDSPLCARLREAGERQWWHMPAHAGRLSLLSGMDLTELQSTDDLRAPSGPILSMGERMAERAGAGASLPLCGGSTLGLQAMILGLLSPGDVLVVPRSAHLAVWNACAIGGIRAVAVPGERLAEAARGVPGARAVLIDSPDYFGNVRDAGAIVAAAHERGMLALIDEAHGAHFPYLDGWVAHAARFGADAWVQSAHKTMPALTGSAWVHLRDAGDAARVRRAQNMIMTTSPSFLTLASLEAARCWMERQGADHLRRLSARVSSLMTALPRWARPPGGGLADPLRPVLHTACIGRTGWDVLDELARRGVDAEMADATRVVLIPSLLHEQEDFDRLQEVVMGLATGEPGLAPPPTPHTGITPPLDVRSAAFAPMEWLQPHDAVGRICSGPVGLYPPGCALWVPGEIIVAEAVEALLACQAAGARVFGCHEGRIPVVALRT